MSNIQKSQAGLLIQSLITLLVFESIILSLEAVISNEKKRNHPRKGLINIPSIDDNECFKWCLVRYLNPVDHNSARITKADKDFDKKFDFKDIKVKVSDTHKIEKKNSIDISVFSYENKEKHSIYVSKKYCVEKHADLILIEDKGKKHYVLIKDFNTFMYDHTLHRRKNIFVLAEKKY